jgi:Protein of unknown function (DUF1566)
LASTSDRSAPAHPCRWSGTFLAQTLLAGAAMAQGVPAQQTCVPDASTLPTSRFQDNGDGTVTDVASKLMWMRCASGQQWVGNRCSGNAEAFNWVDAQRRADQISHEGTAFFNDWRLPTLRDLATITDRACKNPRTNLSVFPGTPAAPFWSSTPRPGEKAEDRALALSFGADGVVLARKDERFHVRLVRAAL